jgi:outer membrane receptor protein involved in Fe transport
MKSVLDARPIFLAVLICWPFWGRHIQAQETLAKERAESSPRLEELIVTGSRIARRDYEAESAIVTVTTEALKAGGQSTLGEALNQLPQLSAASSNTSSTPDLDGGGQSKVDLRGLGSRRTLVLLDGRRMQPSDIYNAIDLNGIPTALIESTEIITGGASATYGSDALAGVINLKTRRDFSGFDVDVQAGVTDQGDGENVDVSATYGGNIQDGRGNLVVSASYYDREEIYPVSSRSFFNEGGSIPIAPAGQFAASGSNLPSFAVVANVFARYGITGPVAPFGFGFNHDGTLYSGGANLQPQPGVNFTNGGSSWDNLEDYLTLVLPLKRYTAFARATYDITPNVKAFAQYSYATFKTSTTSNGPALFNQPPPVPASNPLIQPDLREILNSRPNPNASWFFVALPVPTSFGPSGSKVENDTWQLQYGLSGKIPTLNWTWDAYFSNGRTTIDQTQVNQLSRPVFISLINAPDGGASQCEGGLDLFPLVSVSDSCKQLLRRDPVSRQLVEQDAGEINLQGGLFELPAGELRFAAGAAYRKNSFEFRPDAGLVLNPATGAPDILGLVIGRTAPSEGSTKVDEYYVEFLVPLLANMPLAQRLDLNVGYRYSHYDTIGNAETYKAGLEWQPLKSLFVRAGKQRSIRAPSIGELYAPAASGNAGIGSISAGGGDPCSQNSVYRNGPNAQLVRNLCIEQGIPAAFVDGYTSPAQAAPTLIQGNTELTEEIGDSYNIGAVFRPEFDSDLFRDTSFSVDYYDIKIKDAMGVIPGSELIRECFNANGSNPTYSNENFYCQLITRETATFNFFELLTPTVNLGEFHMSGIDYQLDWTVPLSSLGLANHAGNLAINVLMSHVQKYAIASLQNSPLRDFKGTIGNSAVSGLSHPEWKGIATVSYSNGPLMAGVQARYIDSMENSLNVGTSLTARGVSAVTYFDLFGSYALSGGLTMRLGVSNVADKEPPEWTGLGVTDRSTYDVIGRSYSAGISMKF